MAKYEKYTKKFLLAHPDLSIGEDGLRILSKYIDSGFKAWDVSGISDDVVTKLEILSDFLNIEEFKQNKKGEYELPEPGQMAYANEYARRLELREAPEKIERALPKKPIKKSLAAFMESLPVKGRDWHQRWENISPERKKQLAGYLEKEMKGLSFDWAAGGKVGEPKVANDILLGLAVGDKSETENIRDVFMREFFIASKRLFTPAAWKEHPERTRKFAINFTKKEFGGWVKGPLNTDKMDDAASKMERLSKAGKLTYGLPKGFRSIDQVLRKLPSKSKVKEWWAQVSEMPIGNKIRQNIVDAMETIYGLKLDFRQVSFPDSMLPSRRQFERTFQNAFVASFLENAWGLRERGKPLISRDFNRAAFTAHKVACIKLHRGMQKREAKVEAAAAKAVQKPLARKKEVKRKLAVA